MEKVGISVANFIYSEGEQRPWYFSTFAIYEAAKQAVNAISLHSISFNGAIDSLTEITEVFQNMTKAKIVVITREGADQLVQKLDGVVQQLFGATDDRLDYLRKWIADIILYLIDLIKTQRLLSDLSQLKDRVTQIVEGTVNYATSTVQITLEALLTASPESLLQLATRTQDLLITVKDGTVGLLWSVKSPTESVLGVGVVVVNRLDSQVTNVVGTLLQNAQPVVHGVTCIGTPLVTAIAHAAQPIVVHAQPFVEPYLQRVQTIGSALQEYPYLGPWVNNAVDASQRTLSSVRVYCTADQTQDVEAAVQDVLLSVHQVGSAATGAVSGGLEHVGAAALDSVGTASAGLQQVGTATQEGITTVGVAVANPVSSAGKVTTAAYDGAAELGSGLQQGGTAAYDGVAGLGGGLQQVGTVGYQGISALGGSLQQVGGAGYTAMNDSLQQTGGVSFTGVGAVGGNAQQAGDAGLEGLTQTGTKVAETTQAIPTTSL